MSSALPFERQPLEAPLSDQAKSKLQELAARRVNDYSLYPRIFKAVDFLDKAVGPIIDRAVEEKERHEKRQARLVERGEEPDAAEQERYEAFQRKVEELTKAMDQSIRQVVDTKVWLEGLPNALTQVINTASTHTQRTTQQSILPTPDRSTRAPNADLDGDEDGQVPEGSTQTLPPDQAPSVLLIAALEAQESSWRTKTLTEKYAHDNDYVGWYTNRWHALNPGDSAPPMPSAAIWFAAEEGRRHNGPPATAPGENGNNDSEEEEDSDIEIEREKISIKCPITLLPFEDPVVSSKCNHSFERTAILGMLERSNERRPLPPEQEAEIAAIRRPRDRAPRREQLRQLQPRGIKCPECRTFFVQEDLRPNPVLKRWVQRQLEWQRKKEERARQREEEDDEEMGSDGSDSDDLRGPQRPVVGIPSSPLRVAADRPKLKEDLDSGRVPETQQPPVMDLDEDI
ncbi:hypothetical protein DV735_g5455, partial [Chaetothyriales sp. CBS 134920]